MSFKNSTNARVQFKKRNKMEAKKNKDISWTTKELQTWVDGGLLDKNLLQPNKVKDLADFIIENKEKLYNLYHESKANLNYQVNLPYPLNVSNPEIFGLQLIDKRTGKVSHTMDLLANIAIAKEFNLSVKVEELSEWSKIAEKFKDLTNEQKEISLKALTKVTEKTNGAISRKEIANIIKEIISQDNKNATIRHSSHFEEMKQKRNGEELKPTTREKIGENNNITIKTYGIKLTPAEDKLINALYKLLHKKKRK